MSREEYKTILSSVRPPRVCVLIDRTDPDWQNSCVHVIEYFTTLWGGAYNIIVPTDRETIPDIFWQILETYDPDYVFRYLKTGADLKTARPDEYEQLLQRHIDSFMAANPASDRDRIRKQFDAELERALLGKDPVPNAVLQAEIKCRLAPFWFEDHIVEAEGIRAGSMGHYPLTLISEILGNCDSPSYVASIAASLPGIPQLWYAAVTGLEHDRLKEALDKTAVERRYCNFQEDRRSSFVHSIITNDTKTIVQDAVATVTPFQLTMTQIGSYRSMKYQYWAEPALIIVGDTAEDFCLYYCLSRLRDQVTWLIPAWVRDFQQATVRAKSGGDKLSGQDLTASWFVHGIGELTRYGQKRASLLSASMAVPDVSTLRDALLETAMIEPLGIHLDAKETLAALKDISRFPLVAYEADNQHRDTTMHFTNQETTGFFDTPKPKNFKRVDPKDHRWITEFSIVHHRFPRHASLGSWVVPDQRLGTTGARCGLDGVAYLCPNIAYFGGDIDTVLIRPKVRTPSAFEIFEYLVRDSHITCKVSDKGFLAQDTIRKFGNLEKLGIFLRDEPKRTLFDKFLDNARPSPGVHDDGVFLNDNRRYLNLACITKILGTADKATALIDDLIRSGVFQRGFVFKCAFCRNTDWFSVNDLTQEFECKRCNRRQVYVRNHWREPEEPRWFYKLDEIVYQGHRNDMTVPLLALDYLRRKADDSFLYSSELEFYKPDTTKPFAEADLCCIPSGVLTIGEAKKADRLSHNAEEEERIVVKYRDLAQLLGARQVVFATIAPSWTDSTRARIIEGFTGTVARPTLLTGAELFGG